MIPYKHAKMGELPGDLARSIRIKALELRSKYQYVGPLTLKCIKALKRGLVERANRRFRKSVKALEWDNE